MPEIYLYRAPVDFRKQAQGLAVLVEQELGHNPFTGALYAFNWVLKKGNIIALPVNGLSKEGILVKTGKTNQRNVIALIDSEVVKGSGRFRSLQKTYRRQHAQYFYQNRLY